MRIVKTPSFLKILFRSYVWNIITTEKVLYLTFDDGPTPEITDQVLDILEQNKAKATFFCIGKNVKKYLEIFKRILAEGHAVGNHTYDHLKGSKTQTTIYFENTQKANELIKSNLFRPPYGRIKSQQVKQLQKKGYKVIMWDVLSYDWDAEISKEKVLEHVTKNAKSGSIIVFHDSEKASRNMLHALPKVLDYFSKKGFKFESMDSCF